MYAAWRYAARVSQQLPRVVTWQWDDRHSHLRHVVITYLPVCETRKSAAQNSQDNWNRKHFLFQTDCGASWSLLWLLRLINTLNNILTYSRNKVQSLQTLVLSQTEISTVLNICQNCHIRSNWPWSQLCCPYAVRGLLLTFTALRYFQYSLLSRRSRLERLTCIGAVHMFVCVSVCLSPKCKITRFSQKLSNLELWCLLQNPQNPRWLRSAILKIDITSFFSAEGGPI